MLLKSNFVLLALAALSTTDFASARENWLERNGRAVYLYPRRFGQEQPAVLDKIRNACPGQVCGTLAGQAVTPLLAAQPECSQQDLADAIIDASKQFDAATQTAMVAAAVEYRQVEKNTPPDFTTNPPTLRNSVFCQKAPKNAQLNGLVQAQDPANDPDLFFDPATKSTVRKGTQANTAPFGGAAAPAPAPPAGEPELPVLAEDPAATDCAAPFTVTVTGTATVTVAPGTITATVGGAPAPAITDAAATPTPPAAPSVADPTAANFGSCSTPEIEFGAGFDNRRETSFRPADLQSFNHGSAQGIAIITRFICDTLTNSCNANQAAKDLCATATNAANAAAAKTGAQADAFNAAFGITTNFNAVAVIDDQGRTVSPGTGGSATPAPVTTATAPAATSAPASGNTNNDNTNNGGNTGNGDANTGNDNGGIGNFGKCTVPEIEFAAGFDNRRETSFQPTDKTSFPHSSAQNIDIITQFICDTLTNTCAADQTAKNTCQTARSAASAAAKGTGAQADAFNAAFGITTNFKAVQQIDNTGKPVGGTTVAAAPATNQDISTPATTATPATTQPSNSGAAATGGNLQTFAGALGGVQAPVVTASGNQFQVPGNSLFNNLKSAVIRSCDVQNNLCANAANASGNKNGFTVAACNAQQATCITQAGGQ
ncbi:hypothetical protein D9619_004807 [Psilocybe cf. subviscida]|uniref:Uncharacterized protein n=1 Tax=Psilocybe cf. subviscida TaxID=2480587 RepID=A0A8H5BSM5_9AGAR|nr:hypothetical protein D9619_004807 [Psilocybe cf. subviscida]